VQLITDWGFDGLDVDWEYPQESQQANDYVLLLKACREKLDDYAAQHSNNYHFLLTVAAPAGPARYSVMDLEGMDPYVDQWHLMAYDYAGSWDMTTGHQSSLFVNPDNLEATKFNTQTAVDDYIKRGIDPSKIVIGIPLYGRAFENTDGLGRSFGGIPSGEGIYEGTYLYKDLPRPNAQEILDDVAMAVYSYDPNTKELITYDTVQTAQAKTRWMMDRELGGMVFWEAAGDKVGEKSLIRTTAKIMGELDTTKNLLSYPTSKYTNIRGGALL
jgi:chitinase